MKKSNRIIKTENFFAGRRINACPKIPIPFWVTIPIILLSACATRLISASLPTPTQAHPVIVSTVSQTNIPTNILPWCKDLKQIINLPLSNQIRATHIIYINNLNYPAVKSELWIISLNDGSERMLFDSVSTDIVAFQPDGYRFYILTVNGLFQSDLSGSPFQLVGDKAKTDQYYEKVYSHDPVNTYSPDRKHIAIWDWNPAINTGKTTPLIIHNTDTGQDVQVFQSGPGETILGNWSPDGKQYVFAWYKNVKDYYSVIYSVNADGSDLVPLTEHLNGVALNQPYWSPDGKKIAIANGLGGRDIWILDVPNKSLKHFEISPAIKFDSQVVGGTIVWSPDSKWLAYISIALYNGIVIINTDSGESYCGNNDTNRTIEMMDWR